jgi:hypothetical protein
VIELLVDRRPNAEKLNHPNFGTSLGDDWADALL